MTHHEKFVFLDTKRKLLQPLLERTEAQMLKMMFSKLTEIGIEAIPAESRAVALREFDKHLERLIVEWVVDSDEALIRSQLTKQFGFSALGAQPARRLLKILRERRITNDEDALLVKDFLDGSYLGWTADKAETDSLWDILSEYTNRGR